MNVFSRLVANCVNICRSRVMLATLSESRGANDDRPMWVLSSISFFPHLPTAFFTAFLPSPRPLATITTTSSAKERKMEDWNANRNLMYFRSWILRNTKTMIVCDLWESHKELLLLIKTQRTRHALLSLDDVISKVQLFRFKENEKNWTLDLPVDLTTRRKK